MTGLANSWPLALEPLLAGLERRADRASCWFADVDVSEAQLSQLHLFEVAARHRGVCFHAPQEPEVLVGEMNPLIGLGAPTDPSRHAARVRISFYNACPASARG
jgi:hypothetical protein